MMYKNPGNATKMGHKNIISHSPSFPCTPDQPFEVPGPSLHPARPVASTSNTETKERVMHLVCVLKA